MKRNHKSTAILVCTASLAWLASASAAVLYVNVNSTNATPPYTNWATAANVIQDAIDIAGPGDEIVVTNGVYQTGGRVVDVDGSTNRVAVMKPLTLRSVNGPEVTVIRGYREPGWTNGQAIAAFMRCVYLANGATLVGFTLTNGSAGFGGGVYCNNYSGGGVVSNCLIKGNVGVNGGGTWGGTLTNCTLSGNSATYGGGALGSTLNNCLVISNGALYWGGGIQGCRVNGCQIIGNSSRYEGGGAAFGTLNNSLLTRNSAGSDGGGAFASTLNNCTIVANTALSGGGISAYWYYGHYPSFLTNCIVYFNTASFGTENYSEHCELNFSCTTPVPPSGTGNISADPQLASSACLSATSPCRGAGSPAAASGADLDGEVWAHPPSIGCDEYYAGAVTGPLSLVIDTAFTNVVPGYTLGLKGLIAGRTSASVWEFGDGSVVSNQPFASHAWTTAGDYAVVLRAFNESQPAGISATVMVHVVTQPVQYVSAASTNPVAPYASWATAATNIQDAVDAAFAGGEIVVTNGIYAQGGRALNGALTNRVVLDKPLTLRSVNGPQFTVIRGSQVAGSITGDNAIRCVYLADGASLIGFTLTNGATRNASVYNFDSDSSGGGMWCETTKAVVSNCVVTGNAAYGIGGGSYAGTLFNCTLTGNSAQYYGGGSDVGKLYNCTLTGNSAQYTGGGVVYSTLYNCIVYFNTAAGGDNFDLPPQGDICCDDTVPHTSMNFCCTTPLPTNGVGNISNAPRFVDAAAGNLRLQSNSPCINAGRNADVPAGADLDGNPRIVGGTVDMGAFEFQSPQSTISYAWLQQYGLPTDGSADFADPDGDGHNNWQEWRAWTDPTNPLSALRLFAPAASTNGLHVRWQSVSGQTYFLERSTTLGGQNAFSALASNIVGQAGTTVYSDTNCVGVGPWFYRIGVQE